MMRPSQQEDGKHVNYLKDNIPYRSAQVPHRIWFRVMGIAVIRQNENNRELELIIFSNPKCYFPASTATTLSLYLHALNIYDLVDVAASDCLYPAELLLFVCCCCLSVERKLMSSGESKWSTQHTHRATGKRMLNYTHSIQAKDTTMEAPREGHNLGKTFIECCGLRTIHLDLESAINSENHLNIPAMSRNRGIT